MFILQGFGAQFVLFHIFDFFFIISEHVPIETKRTESISTVIACEENVKLGSVRLVIAL